MQKRLFSTPPSYNTCMPVAYTVQLVMMVWSACTRAAELGSIQNVLPGYLFYNNLRVIFEVVDRREQGNALQ